MKIYQVMEERVNFYENVNELDSSYLSIENAKIRLNELFTKEQVGCNLNRCELKEDDLDKFIFFKGGGRIAFRIKEIEVLP